MVEGYSLVAPRLLQATPLGRMLAQCGGPFTQRPRCKLSPEGQVGQDGTELHHFSGGSPHCTTDWPLGHLSSPGQRLPGRRHTCLVPHMTLPQVGPRFGPLVLLPAGQTDVALVGIQSPNRSNFTNTPDPLSATLIQTRFAAIEASHSVPHAAARVGITGRCQASLNSFR